MVNKLISVEQETILKFSVIIRVTIPHYEKEKSIRKLTETALLNNFTNWTEKSKQKQKQERKGDKRL